VSHSNVPAVFKAGVQAGWYDVLLPTYNFASRGDLKPLVAAAKAKDIGLLTMKALRAAPKGASFVSAGKTLLADGVHSVLRTIKSPEQLTECLRLTTKGDKTPAAKVAQIDLAGQCTLCGACCPCPHGVAIQDVLRTYQYYAKDLDDLDEAFRQYAAIPFGALATSCTSCGRCESACPQGLAVRELIREAHMELELELVRHQRPPARREQG
jgi:predicted aldo/keto reductase-like oxidoreductase